MSIRLFIEGEVFDPELIEIMTQALSAACQSLGLRLHYDAATRLLAMRIIDAGRAGVRDVELLKVAALKDLGPAVKH